MTESRTRTDTTFEDNVVREGTVDRPAGGATATGPVAGPAVAAPPRRDRVRWGPVWAGLIVAVPTFLLLQLATLALGWWDVGPGATGNNADWISGVNGLIALFLGGLTAGASAIWRGFSDGLLHGILVWALTVVSIVFLTLFGGGALLGSLAGVVTDVTGIEQADLPDVAAGQVADVATASASWAVLGLGLGITAAALGGVLGAKMWPSREDAERQRVAVG
ncbi:permease [Blastococcus sp. SYSU DS0533]